MRLTEIRPEVDGAGRRRRRRLLLLLYRLRFGVEAKGMRDRAAGRRERERDGGPVGADEPVRKSNSKVRCARK